MYIIKFISNTVWAHHVVTSGLISTQISILHAETCIFSPTAIIRQSMCTELCDWFLALTAAEDQKENTPELKKMGEMTGQL